MFTKLLVANRGEIACRIIRTARRMGLATVAVYSQADKRAAHVDMADQAVCLGPAPAAQSYLNVEAVLEAARSTGADALHPGYGFLSENAAFAEALAAAGVTFVGPGPKAIRVMGDKVESKRLAAAAGVNTVPGHDGIVQDVAEALRVAGEIGYPVMIKASAGGGGKGMRMAATAAEAEEGFARAQSEAASSFGDDRIFIEKFIERPRHIEIQVLADSHGNMVHLFERECSIQRRHQKVIEEAPSPFLDEETRAAMADQAIRLAREVDYTSAGTVEFIVDQERNFYFLEMNTRLQVEHPVTELITGIDIVEQMIRVADGEKLGFSQQDIKREGWAMEARVYAEDPERGFLPSSGRLSRYVEPPASPGLRIDSGVGEGAEIPVYYDPMIAKVCVLGQTRKAAAAQLAAALESFYIRGIAHNLSFLAAVARHPAFVAGDLSTAFIEEAYGDGFSGADLGQPDRHALAAIAVFLHLRDLARDARVGGGRVSAVGEWRVLLDGEALTAASEPADGDDAYGLDVTVEGHVHAVRSGWRPGAPVFDGEVNAIRFVAEVDRAGEGYLLGHGGARLLAVVRDPLAARLAARMPDKPPPEASKDLLCPMPGLVVSIDVEVGESVKTGQRLAVVEAMKMENVLRAERDGIIARIVAAEGQSLAVDQVILEFTEEDTGKARD